MDDASTDIFDLRLETQADVQHLWERLMKPLGFTRHSIWICFVDDRGAPVPQLTELSDGGDAVPGVDDVARLCEMVGHLARSVDEVRAVAFLVSRPGSWGMTDVDRQIAAALVAGTRAEGLVCHPVHVADDRELMAVAPDDLVAA